MNTPEPVKSCPHTDMQLCSRCKKPMCADCHVACGCHCKEQQCNGDDAKKMDHPQKKDDVPMKK